MNSGLTKNLLPLWTGKELTVTETIELLEEVEGKTDKAKLFDYSNKNTVVLKTKLHNNYRFPIVTKDYATHRLNERKNNKLIKYKMFPD
jgi:predicted nucleic acid-binding protein